MPDKKPAPTDLSEASLRDWLYDLYCTGVNPWDRMARAVRDLVLADRAACRLTDARLIPVEGRGVVLADVIGPVSIGDHVLIEGRVRGVEASSASPVEALVLHSKCRVVFRPGV